MKILVSALEPSANLHLKALLSYRKQELITGLFDPSLGTPTVNSQQFNVMGFWDVLGKIREGKKAIALLVEEAKECDSILLIDAPSFNIRLAQAIKKHYPHKKIIYYIVPKVWAWKKGRIPLVEACSDTQALIFPFEKNFWTKGVYVGNPLLDELPPLLFPSNNKNAIIFMPGSRKTEITRLMPLFHDVSAQIPGRKILVIPATFSSEQIQTLYGNTDNFEIMHNTAEALSFASFAFVCSGTATLECALMGVPLALVYKARGWEYAIAKCFVKLHHVGLANIIADFEKWEEIHPEFLQENANVASLINAYTKADFSKSFNDAIKLRSYLSHGSAQTIADRIFHDSFH